jgi:hypothetical protein
MSLAQRFLARARAQEGVTMVIAVSVMLVTSLLLAGTFVATQQDIGLSHTDTTQKEAYYAALAGVQEFEYQMQVNPNYWQSCAKTTNTLPQEPGSSYKIKILPASGYSECNTSNPIASVIESAGSAAQTFRIESVGSAGKRPEEHHTIIATFKVTGFLNFIYYTNHEDEDPSLYNASKTCAEPNTFYPNTSECQLIEFATGDAINGPMHTNDAVCVGGAASFGLSGHKPPDVVEFYRGLNTTKGCGGTGTYNTATKSYIKGELLPPPTSDSSLESYAKPEDIFSGVTELVLEGATNEIDVTNAAVNSGKPEKKPWPSNGLIYVKQAGGSCEYTYKPYEADNSYEAKTETNCGNVYVKGSYTSPLTVGSADDVIINGEIYPNGQREKEPTGTATLGLIANNFVRVYHPVKEGYEGTAPELETAHNLKLESASHKETITIEAHSGLTEGIKLEVKNSGSQYEVVVWNEQGNKALEKLGLFKEAKQLIGLVSPYVVFGEGAKYAEGETEKLKTLGAETLGHQEIVKVEPKSPHLGKELRLEVKETASGAENEVILFNAKGEQLEKITGIKEAKGLVGHSSSYVVYAKGKNYTAGEKEKLRVSAATWLDETCGDNGKKEVEQFSTTTRECLYTDTPEECDAPSVSAKEDLVHGWGTMENPWIYAAILATTHSFVVDNFNCGPNALGKLNLYGALAQNYRGIVGTGGTSGIVTGYDKDYKYDERLAVDEPPYFLSPLNAGWKVARETSPSSG